jgi:uncharacterized protein (DUF2249 family)
VTETVIDVRRILPRMRHPLVYTALLQAPPGESYRLVNGHDPRPLLHPCKVRYPSEFAWDYEEEGPDVRRVRISRAA